MVLPDLLIARVKDLLIQNVPVAQIIAEAKQQGHYISSSTIYKIRYTMTANYGIQPVHSHKPTPPAVFQPVFSPKNIEMPANIIDTEKVIKPADFPVPNSPIFTVQAAPYPLVFEVQEKLGVAAEITRTKILAKLISGVTVKAARQWDITPGEASLEFDKFVGFLRYNYVQCCVIASTQFGMDENLQFDDEVIEVRKVIGSGPQLFLKHEVEVVCAKYFGLFKRRVIYIHFAEDYVRSSVQDQHSTSILHLEHFYVKRHPEDERGGTYCSFHRDCLENLCTARSAYRAKDYEYISYYIAQLLYAFYLLSPQTLFVVGGELFDQNDRLEREEVITPVNQTPFTNALSQQQLVSRNLKAYICMSFARLYANFGPNLNLETIIYQADCESVIQGALHLVARELKESNLVTPCDFLQQVTSMSPSIAHGQTPARLRFGDSRNTTPTLAALLHDGRE